MDYEKLNEDVQQIVSITEHVPEALREKCFEILLNYILSESSPIRQQPDIYQNANTAIETPDRASNAIPLNAQMRVFMRKYEVTDSHLNAILMLEDNMIHFIKEPAHNVIRRGQKEWALLLALGNAIMTNQFIVDGEQLKDVCEEKGYYDSSNFAGNLKDEDMVALFKGQLVRGGSQNLSSEGEATLAELIRSLAG